MAQKPKTAKRKEVGKNIIKKITTICISVVSMLALTVAPAFAHVIIYPHQVGIASLLDFTVSVPNERDNPVVSVKLLIPNGLSSVTPDATPGWTITTKGNGSGDNATVTEIDWNGGTIPVGQRAEFIFQAQVPPQPTTLNWKAYQTYSDGTLVSWDINPAKVANLTDAQQDELADKENKGEYSTTKIINDLSGIANTNAEITSLNNQSNWLMLLSGSALILSVIGMAIALRRK
jgi:uncharacterized protein YcnI